MTQTARTAETKAADALARLLTYLGDSDNLQHWVTEFEDSLPSPIVGAVSLPDEKDWPGRFPRVRVSFEDGSVLHLTVTQVKEANQ